MGYYFGCGNMGLGILGGLINLVIFVLVVWFIIWLIRRAMWHHHGPGMRGMDWMMRGGDSMETLKNRYAKGEISKEEFEKMKKDLQA